MSFLKGSQLVVSLFYYKNKFFLDRYLSLEMVSKKQ